jgi:DNA (cytosine-5)-methyltransferase 1
MNKRIAIGLFAGIGGLELGMKRAGFQTAALCEIDPVAQAVLAANFKNVPILSDVRNIDTVGKADLLCAGFPCQDLSSVGRKSGIGGARSGLVGEVFRILENSSVDWVVIENVKFMLHLNSGEAMNHVVEGFERLGYRWAYRVVNSQAFGVPQRRHRVFFVATRSGDPRNVLLSDEAPAQRSMAQPDIGDGRIGFYWTEGSYAAGLCQEAIPPLKAGSTIGIPSPPAILFPDGMVGTPHLQDAERIQGFPPGWTEAAGEVARLSSRWKLLGNAVTVPVAEWIGQRIRRPKRYLPVNEIPVGRKWPNAAWSMGSGRFVSTASEWPIDRRTTLAAFLREEPKPLSIRAINGFLSRAEKGSLSFPKGFLERLANYAECELMYAS